MNNHHIVKVTIKGYKLLQSFNDRAEAINFLSGQSCRSGAVIYRDGLTGKRYGHNEAKRLFNH